MIKVVAPHLIECLLGAKDVVDEVEHHKPVIDGLNEVVHYLALSCKNKGVHVDK